MQFAHAIVRASVCVLITVLCGCSESQPPTPSPLVSGLNSYLSYQEARNRLGVGTSGWEIVEDSKTDKEDRRPPYHLLVIGSRIFADLDEVGEIRLYFFNDRLMSVVFSPREPERYLRKLAIQRGIDLVGAQEVKIPPATLITRVKPLSGRIFLRFEDVRLQEEHDNWIRRFS